VNLTVAFPARQALLNVTDPYFRSFDTNYPDPHRAKEWLREFREFEHEGNLPNLELLRLMADHTDSGDPGNFHVDTPELQTADNDYTVGIVLDAVSHSPVYKGSTKLAGRSLASSKPRPRLCPLGVLQAASRQVRTLGNWRGGRIKIFDEDHLVTLLIVDQLIDKLFCQQHTKAAWPQPLLFSNRHVAEQILG